MSSSKSLKSPVSFLNDCAICLESMILQEDPHAAAMSMCLFIPSRLRLSHLIDVRVTAAGSNGERKTLALCLSLFLPLLVSASPAAVAAAPLSSIH
jgi:hypothetical protein